MSRWAEQGDGEYTRTLDDGRVAKVFEQPLLWRAAIDGHMVDDIFFNAFDAMKTVDAWEAGKEVLPLHPTDKRWIGSDASGYSRKSGTRAINVKHAPCGSWKIESVSGRCFPDAQAARRFADERLP